MENSRDLNVFNMMAADSSQGAPSATELMQNAYTAKSHLIELASYINSNPTLLEAPETYIRRIQNEATEAHRATEEKHHLKKAEIDIELFERQREYEKKNPDSLFHRIRSFESALNSYLLWMENVESKFQEHDVLAKDESIGEYEFSQQKVLLLSKQEVASVESALRLYAETQDHWDTNHEHDIKSSLSRYAMQDTLTTPSLKHDH